MFLRLRDPDSLGKKCVKISIELSTRVFFFFGVWSVPAVHACELKTSGITREGKTNTNNMYYPPPRENEPLCLTILHHVCVKVLTATSA